ncbi:MULTISPECIES: (d)CMP kinase [unclassified Rothia (in: high G+C Gram-positive bacteria)]|uniref:(d)CMP kinase n=1 Tax=unclassified Rothia (in: high G+C Gram-positive bacteria) TaxID=2689056 RepID=UPI0019598CD0|nr:MULTISPECIES: (d)CMP kinase [unclassified Rothia (in: high G+C Gram-positive bacteria)]MBM7050810.1 (d)CMP kinase [Rothia sp. ZJ1223]QRZ60985.1 (d)CMP kinase [Rothia sp. ZJ932]
MSAYGNRLVIAMDGPSGSGKSSVAKAVAQHYNLAYLDTGAMYRALTWYCLAQKVDLEDEAAVAEAAQNFPLSQGTTPDAEIIEVDGVDVVDAIREPVISENVSAVASKRAVRDILIRMQRDAMKNSGYRMVAEGRDITTVVAPDADARILLTASEEVRLARRGLQLGGTQSTQQLSAQVSARDAKDSKVNNFTEAAPGVTLIDSSDLNFEETIAAVIAAVEEARGA